MRWFAPKKVWVGKRPGGTAETPVPDITSDPALFGEVLKRMVIIHRARVTIGVKGELVEAVIETEDGRTVRAEGCTVRLALCRGAWVAEKWW